MILELILICSIGFTGYSVMQKIITPFAYLFGSSSYVASGNSPITMVPYPIPSQGSSPIINNQNSNGLFAYNYNSADQALLPFPPAYLLAAAGTGYLFKKMALSGAQVIHNPSSWSYWALHLPKDQEFNTALQQEIAARLATYGDSAVTSCYIIKQLDGEHSTLTWFIRIATLTVTVRLGWLFEVADHDITLAKEARSKLELIRKQVETTTTQKPPP